MSWWLVFEPLARPAPATAIAPLRPASPLALYEHPAWSPDGRRLAFAEWWVDYHSGGISRSRARLLMLDWHGRAPRVLWQSRRAEGYSRIGAIQWSPDGRKLLYSEEQGPFDTDVLDRVRMRLITPAGKVVRNVSRLELSEEWKWSPDGRWLAFVTEFGSNLSSAPSPGLWMMRLDGRGLRRLVPVSEKREWLGDPAWSPDGRHLAFLSGAMEEPHGIRLRIVDLRGHQEVIWQQERGAADRDAIGPAWSSKGDALFVTVAQTLVAVAPSRPEATRAGPLRGRVAEIAPRAGVLASFIDDDLTLIPLNDGEEQALTHGRVFAGKLGSPRLGEWYQDNEFAAEVAIGPDPAIAITADRALYRFASRRK